MFLIKGSSQVPIDLISNYYEVSVRKNYTLYQYHVDFEPAIDSKRLRIGLLYSFKHLFQDCCSFDGQQLYSVYKLEEEITTIDAKRNFDDQTIKIKIKFTNTVTPESNEALRLFNILLKRFFLFLLALLS